LTAGNSIELRAAHPENGPPVRRPRHQSAFTLIELLVTVGIIAMLIGLLLPAINSARRAAQKAECATNMHKLTSAWAQYANVNRGALVLAGFSGHWSNQPYDGQILAMSWIATGSDTDQIRKGAIWPFTQSIRIYKCPGDPGEPLRSYAANVFVSGPLGEVAWKQDAWGPNISRLEQIRNASETVWLIEEASPTQLGFIIPPLGDQWLNKPAAFHRDGLNLSFTDGHVEYYRFADGKKPGPDDLKRFQAWIGVNLNRYNTGK
jgi:prepilin-type N-terminal cleavage/methylation domain-containing protein/prepilin-type processing-associated H-X9-DG protein